MLRMSEYTGNSPMRVSKDAKYTVTTGGSIRLEYVESQRVRYLMTTDDHESLATLVNEAKEERTGRKGGSFYINEFRSVLIPDGQGGRCLWLDNYEGTLEFREGALTVSPVAPDGLKAGDRWPGPHVGIPYVLNAGATDLRYDKIDGRRRETVFLSDDVGATEARRTADFVSKVKGSSGGRVFVNEEWELFAPVGVAGDWQYLYIGRLTDTDLQWFRPPVEFPLP